MRNIDRLLSSTKWNRVFINTTLYQDYLTAQHMVENGVKPSKKKLNISHTIYPNGEVKVWKK